MATALRVDGRSPKTPQKQLTSVEVDRFGRDIEAVPERGQWIGGVEGSGV